MLFQPPTVPQATLRQVVRALRARLAAEITDFAAWPEVALVLHQAELGPLAFLEAEQRRQAERRAVRVAPAGDDEPMDRRASARVRAARAHVRAR